MARLDVFAFYQAEGVELKGAGPWKGKCPFHADDHASFSVTKTGRFKCFACEVKGSVFDFYSQRHGVEFPDALREVAKYAPGVNLDAPRARPKITKFEVEWIDQWHAELAKHPDVIAYLVNRGITPEAIAEYRLGWTGDFEGGKERISIPLRDHEGRYVNAKLYKVGGDASNKMISAATGTPAMLFIPPKEVIERGTAVLVLEGEFDVIVARAHGWNAQTGTAGAGTWKKEWNAFFAGLVVYVLYDADDAGTKGARAVAAALHGVGKEIRIATWPEGSAPGYDATDWYARDQRTDAELRALLDRGVPFVPAPTAHKNGDSKGQISFVALESIAREEVSWLWHPYIPRGKLTLLVGNPGVGKSFLSSAITSAIAMGWPLPGGEPLAPGAVIVLAAEDGLADTLRPRLEDMGCTDLSRIWVLPVEADFNIVRDLERLAQEIIERRPILVIVDPLTAYLGGKMDIYRDNEVRASVAPLAQIAAQHGTAILGVMHLTKGARDVILHRVIGSVGFTGLARSVLAVAPNPQDRTQKIMAPIKSNLTAEGEMKAFSIEGGRFAWGTTPPYLDVESLLTVQPGKDNTALLEAEEFVVEVLPFDQEILSKDIFKRAKEAGITQRTVERAKKALKNIFAVQREGEWFWVRRSNEVKQTRIEDTAPEAWWNKEPDA